MEIIEKKYFLNNYRTLSIANTNQTALIVGYMHYRNLIKSSKEDNKLKF